MLLVGDFGVGKILIVEGLVWFIVNGKVLKLLENVEVYSLDIGVLVVGIKYCGDFEKCLK